MDFYQNPYQLILFDLLKISNSFVQAITSLHSTNSVLLLFFLHFTPNHPLVSADESNTGGRRITSLLTAESKHGGG